MNGGVACNQLENLKYQTVAACANDYIFSGRSCKVLLVLLGGITSCSRSDYIIFGMVYIFQRNYGSFQVLCDLLSV